MDIQIAYNAPKTRSERSGAYPRLEVIFWVERAPTRFVVFFQKVIHRKSPKKPQIVDNFWFFRVEADFLKVIHKSSDFLGYFVDK